MENKHVHIAWRFGLDSSGKPLYVAGIRKPGEKGDKYHYTNNAINALAMTEYQCKTFCRYMVECASQGFWR